jgi:hypothetical protein
MLYGSVIKKASIKPSPSAKWFGTFSTPVVGYAVASSRSKSIFDTTIQRFSRLIDEFWPNSLEPRLWSWDFYPSTA